MTVNKRVLVNAIAFQVGWFACVLGAAYALPVLGTTVGAAIVAWHVAGAQVPRAELTLILIAAVTGAIYDTALAAAGWIAYAQGTLGPNTAPYWIIALWMLFATTLNLSLAWLKPRLWLAAVLGGLGAPLAYLGGAKLGALVLVEPSAALGALGLGWALVTPALLYLARRYDGISPSTAAVPTHAGAGHA